MNSGLNHVLTDNPAAPDRWPSTCNVRRDPARGGDHDQTVHERDATAARPGPCLLAGRRFAPVGPDRHQPSQSSCSRHPSDHTRRSRTETPAVSRYDMRFYYQGATQPFQTNSLGKPAPGADGLIHLDLARTLTAWPLNVGTTFEARVSAVGPGGAGESARSNPFTFSSPLAVTSLTSNVAFPAPAGTAVTWTATCRRRHRPAYL